MLFLFWLNINIKIQDIKKYVLGKYVLFHVKKKMLECLHFYEINSLMSNSLSVHVKQK